MLTARPAVPLDVTLLAERLRPEDVAEVRAASGLGAYEGVRECFAHTPAPWVGQDGSGSPVCMGGVVPSGDPMIGIVWALCAKEVEAHKVSFLRRSIPWVHLWQDQYPILTNCVDERNELHIRWLRWLGFKFIRRHPAWGFEKRPFIEFVRINDV